MTIHAFYLCFHCTEKGREEKPGNEIKSMYILPQTSILCPLGLSLEIGLNPYVAAATAIIGNNSLKVIGLRLSNFDVDYCMLRKHMF